MRRQKHKPGNPTREQWMDISVPAYTETAQIYPNPTHGRDSYENRN